MLMHLDNEDTLLAEARCGSNEAFNTLVKQYDRKISRIAMKITRNPEDADDAIQDAFLKAYSNLATFQGGSRFYTWLARIAINEALTRLRRQGSRRLVSLQDDGVPRNLVDRGENPEQRYARNECRRIIADAVRELDPSLQRVLHLRYDEDLSSEEIAQQLGLSVPAVKSRLMRARLRLRSRLDGALRKDSDSDWSGKTEATRLAA